MQNLISVSHDEIKAALDEEKETKKRKAKKKPSASDRASGENH